MVETCTQEIYESEINAHKLIRERIKEKTSIEMDFFYDDDFYSERW